MTLALMVVHNGIQWLQRFQITKLYQNISLLNDRNIVAVIVKWNDVRPKAIYFHKYFLKNMRNIIIQWFRQNNAYLNQANTKNDAIETKWEYDYVFNYDLGIVYAKQFTVKLIIKIKTTIYQWAPKQYRIERVNTIPIGWNSTERVNECVEVKRIVCGL